MWPHGGEPLRGENGNERPAGSFKRASLFRRKWLLGISQDTKKVEFFCNASDKVAIFRGIGAKLMIERGDDDPVPSKSTPPNPGMQKGETIGPSRNGQNDGGRGGNQ